jgi:TPR repeat protein
MLQQGVGIQQDKQAALEMYMKAAEQNYPLAQYAYGLMLKNGEGIRKNLNQAFSEIMKAAEQGLDDAENQIGEMFEQGEGIYTDDNKAVYWYKRAVQHGNVDACCNLARMCENGHVKGEKDEVNNVIVDLYRSAAENGNAKAQYCLGKIYYDGNYGIKKDKEKAKEWILMSAKQGYQEAEQALNTWFTDVPNAVEYIAGAKALEAVVSTLDVPTNVAVKAGATLAGSILGKLFK